MALTTFGEKPCWHGWCLTGMECPLCLRAEVERLRLELAAAREALRALVSYTEACEGLLITAPSGQVKAARAVLAATPAEPKGDGGYTA